MEQREETTCPACAERVLLSARKCKHCGEWIRPESNIDGASPADAGADVPRAEGVLNTPTAPIAATTSPLGGPISPAVVVAFVAVAVGVAVFLFFTSQGTSPRGAVATMLKNGVASASAFGSVAAQGDLTHFSLVGHSEKGDCHKVYAHFRVDGGPELTGTFLYASHGSRVIWHRYSAAWFERRGENPFADYSGEMTGEERGWCDEVFRTQPEFESGPYRRLE